MKKARRYFAWLLVIALLLCGCGVETPPATTEVTQGTTMGTAQETTITMQAQNWSFSGEWIVNQGEGGSEVLVAPEQENAAAVYGTQTLASSWEVNVAVAPGSAQCVRILLCGRDGEAENAAALNISDGKVWLSIDSWGSGRWKNIAAGEAVAADLSAPMQLKVYHFDGAENVWASLMQADQELAVLKTNEITARTLSMLTQAGVGADGAAEFSGFSVTVPEKVESGMDVVLGTMKPGDEGFYRAIAAAAVDDMLANFWVGDTKTGQIRPTWGGYDTQYDWRGSTWETALLVFGIRDMWEITGDTYYYDLLCAEAKFFRENFTEFELENAGGLFMWANDDTGWNAMMLLSFYSVTGDMWFVDRVIGLLDNANERWYDEELGGLRYKDDVDYMALCEVAITWSWLQLWEITGQQRFYDLSMESYERLYNRMVRDDGLYFMEANAHWTRGEKDYISEAASSSFLGGNMCMAALSVKFYKLTGEQKYLDRAYLTNQGLLQYYDNDGVLLNDRDAWCNATFAAFYVSEVLSLPDTEEMQTLLKNTAVSIVTNARTEDGYYGGSWSGPAEGSGSVWYNAGSVPQQSMTTGNTVLMVTAAAMLEAGIEGYLR